MFAFPIPMVGSASWAMDGVGIRILALIDVAQTSAEPRASEDTRNRE
jgi:hypothetical protein